MKFDEAVDGFGAAVVGAAGVEVAEELAAPLSQGASEAGDFGDRAAGEGVEDLDRDPSARGVAGLVIDRAELFGRDSRRLRLKRGEVDPVWWTSR